MDIFFCLIDSENAKKCLHSNSVFAILTLRDGDGGETSPRVKSSQMPEPGSKPNKYRARQAASGTARERMLNEGESAAGKQATAGKRLEQTDYGEQVIEN